MRGSHLPWCYGNCSATAGRFTHYSMLNHHSLSRSQLMRLSGNIRIMVLTDDNSMKLPCVSTHFQKLA